MGDMPQQTSGAGGLRSTTITGASPLYPRQPSDRVAVFVTLFRLLLPLASSLRGDAMAKYLEGQLTSRRIFNFLEPPHAPMPQLAGLPALTQGDLEPQSGAGLGSALSGLWDGLLRAVPKKKVSHSRKSMRSANKGLKDRTGELQTPSYI